MICLSYRRVTNPPTGHTYGRIGGRWRSSLLSSACSSPEPYSGLTGYAVSCPISYCRTRTTHENRRSDVVTKADIDLSEKGVVRHLFFLQGPLGIALDLRQSRRRRLISCFHEPECPAHSGFFISATPSSSTSPYSSCRSWRHPPACPWRRCYRRARRLRGRCL